MKNTSLALTLSILFFTSSANALELIVVNNYQAASSPEIWKKAKTDQVPSSLLTKETLESPNSSYAHLFPNAFMQEDLFAVCYKSCANKDIFRVQGDEIESKYLKNWNVIEQSNVYFWLKKYFAFLDEKMNFQVENFLKVMTNREVREETKGKVMKDNAFFNPKDFTLSFLPATKSFLFKIMGGKINRSGFDPSLVIHEASHYLFQHLFPNPINTEITGLNEGFADYMANIFLKNPKLGLVMMQGKTLRDSSSNVDSSGFLKTYVSGMEVHAAGERVAYALWKTREKTSNKNEFDRLVIDAVKDLGRNPYSTIHDFKEKMLERIPFVVPDTAIQEVKSLWDFALAGEVHRIHNLDFLEAKIHSDAYVGFKTKQVVSKKFAEEFGIPSSEESNFSIIQIENISPTQIAILMATEDAIVTTPYWLAIDVTRNNVLGIYNLDKELVTNPEELEKVSSLASKVKDVANFVKDFSEKIKSFTDLSQGKGKFDSVYKAKNIRSYAQTLTFNGLPINGHRIHMKLKRRFLTGVLMGSPEIESVELYSLPLEVLTNYPILNQERVIGYRLTLKTGTVTEVILNKHALK